MNNYQEYLAVLEEITKLKGLEAEVYNAIGFLRSPVMSSPLKTISEICDEIERQRDYHHVYTEGGAPQSPFAWLIPKELKRKRFEKQVAAIVDRLSEKKVDRLRRLEDGRLVRSYGDWPQGECAG